MHVCVIEFHMEGTDMQVGIMSISAYVSVMLFKYYYCLCIATLIFVFVLSNNTLFLGLYCRNTAYLILYLCCLLLQVNPSILWLKKNRTPVTAYR